MALYRSAYRIVEASRVSMKLEPQIFYRSNMAPSKNLSAAVRAPYTLFRCVLSQCRLLCVFLQQLRRART
jgi:hypothetical protein